jgi:hypothetical protein
MRQGLTIVPAGVVLVVVVALLGADGHGAPPSHGVGWLDDRFGQPVAPICLLLRPDVESELRLDQRQVAGAREMFSQLIERLLKVKEKTGQAALFEKQGIDEAMAAWLHHELAEAQLERLTQISFQWEGASALRRPSVATYLSLGERQRVKIKALLVDRERRQAAGVLSPAEFDRISREALAVLTPLQKQQWDELLGPPCRFSVAYPAGLSGDPAAGQDLKGQPPRSGR